MYSSAVAFNILCLCVRYRWHCRAMSEQWSSFQLRGCLTSGMQWLTFWRNTERKNQVNYLIFCTYLLCVCYWINWRKPLSFPVEHKPQTTLLRLQLCSVLLSPSSSRYTCCPYLFLQISFTCSFVVLFLCGHAAINIRWSACWAMLSSHRLRECLSQVHFLRCIWFSTGSAVQCYSATACYWWCLASLCIILHKYLSCTINKCVLGGIWV